MDEAIYPYTGTEVVKRQGYNPIVDKTAKEIGRKPEATSERESIPNLCRGTLQTPALVLLARMHG